MQEVIDAVTAYLDRIGRPCERVLTAQTLLVSDLGLGSVDFVVIFELLQEHTSARLNFIDLIMPDYSNYVDDLCLGDIASFLNAATQPDSVAGDSESVLHVTSDPYFDRRLPIDETDISVLRNSVQSQHYEPERLATQSTVCFLVCSPRSGSTLLRRMLACHPQIFAPMELHLMAYRDFAHRQSELGKEALSHLLEGTIVARQEVRGMSHPISAAVDAMYARDGRSVLSFYQEIDRYLQAKVFLDKSPTYPFSRTVLERIKTSFANAKFIHLTREPNAVIKSLIDAKLGDLIRFAQTSGIDPRKFPEALWCLCENNIQAALADCLDITIQVAYEDVVVDPNSELRKIFRFLGLEEDVEIDPYDSHIGVGEDTARFAGDLKFFLRRGVDASVATEWMRFPSLAWLSSPSKLILESRSNRRCVIE